MARGGSRADRGVRVADLIPVLVAGAIGVGLSSRFGCRSAPPLADGRDRAGLLAISCGVGFAAGLYQLFQSVWPPFAHQVEILDRQSGMPALAAWVNVGLPWSIPHYFVGSVGLEILYRLAPIPILTWLISNLALRGRGQAATFWSVGVLAAFLEPLTSLLITVRGPLPAATLAFELFDAAIDSGLQPAGSGRLSPLRLAGHDRVQGRPLRSVAGLRAAPSHRTP